MEVTTGCTTNNLKLVDYRTIPNGSFRISYPAKKSRTIEFFEDLYTYPPKFRVKWDTIDELHEDPGKCGRAYFEDRYEDNEIHEM